MIAHPKDSRARLTYIGSRLKRKRCAAMERDVDKRKLARYETTEVMLADEQHTQMCNVMDVIDEVAVDDLECIFKEGEIHDVEAKLREVWTTDNREEKQKFQKDQAKNGEYFGYKICITYIC